MSEGEDMVQCAGRRRRRKSGGVRAATVEVGVGEGTWRKDLASDGDVVGGVGSGCETYGGELVVVTGYTFFIFFIYLFYV